MSHKKTKLSLKDFQHQFIEALFASEQHQNLVDKIQPAGKLASGKAALGVHEDGYVCRLTEALGEIYEGVWSVLGDKDFFDLAKDYIRSHRSFSYNLNHYGREMPGFLNQSAYAQEFLFLPDLARFELAFSDAFHAAEHEPLPNAELMQIPSNPEAIIQFGPSVIFLSMDYAVHEIWKQRHHREGKLSDYGKPEHVMLYKRDGRIFIEHLVPIVWNLLHALASEKSLIDVLGEADKADEAHVSEAFYILAGRGLAHGIMFP